MASVLAMSADRLVDPTYDSKSEVKAKEKPEHIRWKCELPKTTEIVQAFSFATSVNELMETQKRNGCFSTSTKCLFLKAILNTLSCKVPCCERLFKTDEKVASAFAGRLLRQQAAWSYQVNEKAVANLKTVVPWNNTPYAKAKDMFAAARADLFAGKNTKYSSVPLQCSITTCDGVELSAVYFPGKAKKAILLAVGLTAMYEECMIDYVYDKHVAFFKDKCGDPNVLIVNTRGIGLSQGVSTPQSMPLDIYTAYKFLIAKFSFKPEDVLVYGHSLGGPYGLQGAALIQKEYPNSKISAVVDRSLVSLADVGGVQAANFTSWKYLKGCVGWLAHRFIETNGLSFNCEAAYKSLKGRVVAIVSEKDTTVPYAGSFTQNMTSSAISQVIPLYSNEKGVDHHIRPFTDTESETIALSIQEILA